jgi:hypothetical protein
MRATATALVFLALAAPSYALSGAGPGASSCLKFALDSTRNPASEEQYFIWAQGYMSAIVMMAPGGIDDKLDFLPASYPKDSQMTWIRSVCTQDPSGPIVTLSGFFTVTSVERQSTRPVSKAPSIM